jgi:peptidoglycan/LPS O-acetylase OafA/YrhL
MKPHRFALLDGMRGIAALAVAFLHAGLGFGLPVIPAHGYLAVDFFFCLSGFVICHAYEARLRAGMTFGRFFRLRLIRLYPMIFVAGLLVTAAIFMTGDSALRNGGDLPLLIVGVFTLLPLGLLVHLAAFPLNGPLWSLFFEMGANIAYFFEAKRDSVRPKLFISLGFFAVCLAAVTLLAGSMIAVGFSGPLSFLSGLPRVGYSYLAGMLVYRYAPALPRLPAWALALALAALFAVPALPDHGLYDMIAVLAGFPLLVAFSARAAPGPGLGRVWVWLGELSYPLYVIHEPVLRLVFRLSRPIPPLAGAPALPAYGGALLAILLAYALLFLYDQKLRAWLSRGTS